ncbi:sugar transferase [Vibrio genomosp. F10]|uniref:Sugar transferase n=2 Tax=Vibrio genomosp. F10 TaxID=723171 RepID=A0A1B9QZS9_9VIBR|nr:sugar transferase [Vibrio genomosp. F10]OCH76596.1 sugar transferase [Vibrio genomosp. F10]OEE34681.1 sugar transferase [Vibrio genomosp. F10 str. ZF-129]OEE83728.1 sugar transferase [Vibrio genomosp. F10 str. 9ZD137]OEE93424.1 sugar transferase [Vibrio genomosp. F10 str. 9ZC157]OEF05659.1 sugar transferase [Vibrio genomosp. F10 str. 9ZB36]
MTNKSSRISIWFAKRAFDLVGSVVALLLLSPIMPFIAIAIKLTSTGPVFYKQLRVGKSTPSHMAFFDIIKFRTMYEDAESRSGAVWATEGDPRITPVGRFLRKTRLDEIPQLFNVIRGEMSLIGPRPERPSFYNKLETAIPYFADRTYGVMPGITGLAQVNQGYDTCIDDVRRKVGFDHSYALSLGSLRNWLLMDLSIISKTILVMVDGRGR